MPFFRCADLFHNSLPDSNVASFIGTLAVMSVAAAGAAAFYYTATSRRTKIKPIVDLDRQTVELPGGEHERVSAMCKDGALINGYVDDVTTLYESFRRGCRESNNGRCVGYRKKMPDGSRPYVWLRYSDVVRRATNLAKGFLRLGVKPGQETFVGIYCQNRPEWLIAEQACYTYSMVVVPLYDTLGAEACSFIINQAQIQLILVDNSKKAQVLLHDVPATSPLRYVVMVEEPDDDTQAMARRANVTLLPLEQLELEGGLLQNCVPPQPPTADSLATICYTSGTTGNPKGVMLSHWNVLSDSSVMHIFRNVGITPADVVISYLPLAHMFERLLEHCLFLVGAQVGYFSGDVKQLMEDIQLLQPTLLPLVPRVINRIYDKVLMEVGKTGFKRFLFDWAVSSKTQDLKKGIVHSDTIWDRLVFRKVREGLGNRVRFALTGSAPASADALTFIRVALGCIVLEGYGQTECGAACTVTLEGDHTTGHVGPPIPCNRVKLVDVPEMNYYARNNRGEICIWGSNVFLGYYKDPEKTAEVLDADGWLHTGDIGEWLPSGALRLIDRKKHIFKLSQGEYIAPEKIENVYLKSRFVSQVYVHGESLKSCLVAVVVPDAEVLQKFCAKETSLKSLPFDQLCQNKVVKKLIIDDMVSEGKKAKLCSFEQVKDIYVHAEPFSIENNLLTPTLKTRRPQLREYFKQQIAAMYVNLS